MSKFWNFIKNQSTETQEESVELRISGDIMSDDDGWIYEWFGIPVASPNSFRNELAQYKGKDITVWIDSYGGDVFAGAGIYNALKEHDGKVTAKITKAMSAASVIAMAADEILMSPVGIMMIHNPLSYASGYASDMRKTADVLDTVKETILNAYCDKVNKSREEISSMMDEETYMDANTAINQGFADGILYQDNSEPPKVMNFAFNRCAILNCANDSIKRLIDFQNKQLKVNFKNSDCQCSECSQTEEDCKCSECRQCSCCDNPNCCGCNCEDKKCEKSTASNCGNIIIKNKGEKDMVIKNVADFKNQFPDMHNEVYNSGNIAGIQAERDRLKAFDALNGKVDPAFLNEEKYKDGATAQDVLFRAMQEGKMINSAYMNQVEIDAQNANKVPADSSDNSNPDEVTGTLNFVQNIVKKTLGK